jgi:hypothetical protein
MVNCFFNHSYLLRIINIGKEFIVKEILLQKYAQTKKNVENITG